MYISAQKSIQYEKIYRPLKLKEIDTNKIRQNKKKIMFFLKNK